MTRTPAVMEIELKPCPDDAAIRYAQEVVRRYAVMKTTDDNFGRAAASAEYRVANSEIARCYLRLLSAYNPNDRLREALEEAVAYIRWLADGDSDTIVHAGTLRAKADKLDAALSHKD